MERDERRRADALDRYWDTVLRGETPSRPGGVDTATVAVIAYLREGQSLPHVAAVQEQVRRQIGLAAKAQEESVPAATLPLGAGTANVPVGPRPVNPPAGARGARWAAVQLATAALLLLTLIAGFVAVWQGRSPDDNLIAVPALLTTPDAASSTPEANAVVDKTLFAATFAADELPTGEVGVVFYRLTLDPGTTLPQLGGLSCGCSHFALAPGVGAEFIQSGEYTVRLDAPIRIQRGEVSTDSEEVPARTDITLSPGDAAIYPVYDAPGVIRNAGSIPVVVVGVVIVGLDGSVTPPVLPAGVRGEVLSQSVPSDWQTLPAGPVTVTLRQVTLSAKATMGPYEATALEALQLEQGAITRGILNQGETAPRVRPPVHYAGTSESFAFADVSPGVRHMITNVRAEPAVFRVLTIEPAGREPDLRGP